MISGGGIAAFVAMKVTVAALKRDVIALQSKVKQIGNVLVKMADIRGEIRVLDTREIPCCFGQGGLQAGGLHRTWRLDSHADIPSIRPGDEVMGYFSAILLLLCTPAMAAPIEGRAQVIDGDTIAVEGAEARIRLDAIDAPESSQPCFDEAGKRYLCGARAAEALAEMISRNGRVSCTPKERDKYGRIVAVCRIGDVELQSGDGPPRLGGRIREVFGRPLRDG